MCHLVQGHLVRCLQSTGGGRAPDNATEVSAYYQEHDLHPMLQPAENKQPPEPRVRPTELTNCFIISLKEKTEGEVRTDEVR